MEVKTGIATNIRNAVEISSSGENSSASTTHISLFKIDGQPIKVKSSEMPVIDENDCVTVSGKLAKGVLEAYAYKNISNGVSGNRGIGVYLLLGFLLPIIGISVLVIFTEPFTNKYMGPITKLFFDLLPIAIGSTFLGVGIYSLYCGTQVMKAEGLLKSIDKP